MSQSIDQAVRVPVEVKHEPCPKCQAMLPVYEGYKTWCDQCGWNLEAQLDLRPQPLFQRLYATLSRRTGEDLFAEMKANPPDKARLVPARLLAYVIAGCVHAITLAFIGLGLWLCIFAFPTIGLLGVIIGLPFLTLVWFLLIPHPRQTKAPILEREKYPGLHALVERIAQALGSSPVDSIRYDMNYNAAFGRFGWRRRSALILGLPLVASLDGQELVALISHELAHGVSGDPNKGLFLGSAVSALGNWYGLIDPSRRWTMRFGFVAPLMFIINLVCLPISWLLWLLGYLLVFLTWHDLQRAEYRADWLGAQVAGSTAQLSLLDKAQLYETFTIVLRFSYIDRKTGTFFPNLKRRTRKVPARELERLRRIEALSTTRVDYSHPSVSKRMDFLKAHPVREPQVSLSEAEEAGIERELLPLENGVQNWMMSLDRLTFQETFKVKV